MPPVDEIAMLERLAVLETKMTIALNQITHIDICVDKLRQTVWIATGGAIALMGVFEFVVRVVFGK